MGPRCGVVHYSRGQGIVPTYLSCVLIISFLQKLQYLKDQAEVIKMFGEKSQNIWKNVVIIAKEGKVLNHSLNFQVKKKLMQNKK